MKSLTEYLWFNHPARVGFINITSQVEAAVQRSGVQAALAALKSGKLDAAVYDEPLLNYAIRRHFAGQERVLPLLLQRQFYAVAIPLGSPFRTKINMALLEFTQSQRWAGLVRRYLGPGGG